MRRKWDVSSETTRKRCIEEILTRLEEQKGTDFGIIAAEDLISIVAQNIGPDIYNLAIKDAKKLIQDHLSDLDVGLDLFQNTS